MLVPKCRLRKVAQHKFLLACPWMFNFFNIRFDSAKVDATCLASFPLLHQ